MSSLIQEYELGPKQTDQLTDGLFKKNDGTTWVRYAGVDYQVTGGGLPATGWTPEGDVLTVQSDGTIAAEPGGGSQPGVAIVRKFPFAYNTAGLSDGVGAELYVPTAGDLLLDAWMEIDTAWDGTTPLGDFAPVAASASVYGLYAASNNGFTIDMTGADTASQFPGILAGNDNASAFTNFTLSQAGLYNNSSPNFIIPQRVVPAVFLAATPIRVWVTQNSNQGGSDPGSTQGAAILYLVTATPV